MGVEQPFLYHADSNGAKFPIVAFDPKAVTRASYAPKPQKPKQDGPLVSFNRHPDAHMVLSYRSMNYVSMGPRTKSGIKWLRRLQLFLRILELNAAIGLLTLMILITNVDVLQGWVIRITAGVVALNCAYAIYHLSRSPSARPPASSAAYQLFAGITDLTIMPLYAYGTLAVLNNGSQWQTRLSSPNIMDVFIPTVYYLFISAAGVHFASLCISAWLGYMYRKISLMPPDMNPLESHLTSRARHKKNKSSIATTLTEDSIEKRLSTPLEGVRRSGLPYQDVSRPPTVPFMHTRTGSRGTITTRDSRMDLPSRQYQITPGNSPRNSGNSVDFKRMSMPRLTHQGRGSYTEIPLGETGSSRPSTARSSIPPSALHPQMGKFSESWTPTDSLISRTQERNRVMNQTAASNAKHRNSKAYEALTQRYNLPDSDEYESDEDEHNLASSDLDNDLGNALHPDPLGSNPPTLPRVKTPFYPHDSALSEVSQNARRVSRGADIADEKPLGSLRNPWQQRNRNSSIQPESDFFAKPYGELKAATPPIIIGSGRQVSSGNDYETTYTSAYGRRNVSGKIVEEGRAGDRGGGYTKYRGEN